MTRESIQQVLEALKYVFETKRLPKFVCEYFNGKNITANNFTAYIQQ